jgi:hypothetical protein
MTDDVTIPADVARDMAAAWRNLRGGPTLDDLTLTHWADLLDPKPLTLREKVAKAWCAEVYGESSGSALNPSDDQLDAADAVLAVIADEMERRPLVGPFDGQGSQRDADVAWLRGQA